VPVDRGTCNAELGPDGKRVRAVQQIATEVQETTKVHVRFARMAKAIFEKPALASVKS
jgi:hypothetical protein